MKIYGVKKEREPVFDIRQAENCFCFARAGQEYRKEHGIKRRLTCYALGKFNWLIISRKRQRKRRDSFFPSVTI